MMDSLASTMKLLNTFVLGLLLSMFFAGVFLTTLHAYFGYSIESAARFSFWCWLFAMGGTLIAVIAHRPEKHKTPL